MKRGLALLAPFALAACSDLSVDPLSTPAGDDLKPSLATSSSGLPDRVVAGEVIVKVRDGVDLAELAQAHAAKLERMGYKDLFAIFAGVAGAERDLAAKLAADPRVEYAEPNYLRQLTAVPDTRLWAFYNPGGLSLKFVNDPNGRDGQTVTSFISKADADEDGNYDGNTGFGAGGTAVVVGSVDTGVDFNHPELQGRLIAGKDWYDNDNDPSDTPDQGHGTHTTGTIAGLNVGVAGVAGASANVKVYVQRVCGANGCPTAAIVNAINAGADYLDPNGNHLVAMNLSLGGLFESQAEKDAILRATNAGVLIIASAGNDGTSRVSCPACDPNSMSVAATNWKDTLSSYSNWGSGLDISAPGGQMYSNTTEEAGILSAVPAGYTGGSYITDGPISGARYAYYQGTSMAAPQVTGAAAIVASKAGIRGSALRTRLQGTTDNLGAAGYDTYFGNGRLNSYRAVTNTSLTEGSTGGGGTTDNPPTSSFTKSCSGLTCTFTSTSSDDKGITRNDWTFGDGGSSSNGPAVVSHTYARNAGTRTVTLKVTDNAVPGQTGTSSQTVSCNSKRCS